jgi:hypothetical protein
MSGHGGKRAGAGKPKGSLATQTIEKMAAREALRQIVLRDLEPLVAAQKAQALGLKYLVTRGSDGKFVKVTEAMAGKLTGDEIIEVWEKEPSTAAFTDLMNRALDKPKEQEQDVNVKGDFTFGWKGPTP